MPRKRPLTYKEAGVDYDPVDRFKRLTQKAGAKLDRLTSFLDRPRRFQFDPGSRGESAAIIRVGAGFFNLGFVVEGLGTKNLIADACADKLGVRTSYYDVVARDTVAMILNDLITKGALPIAV